MSWIKIWKEQPAKRKYIIQYWWVYFKPALIIITLFVILHLLAGCKGMEASSELTATSIHTRETTPSGKPYNQFNPGAGVHITTSNPEGWRFGGRALAFKNSFKRLSVAGAGTAEYCWQSTVRICPGVMAGLISGYNDSVVPMAAPTLEVGYDRASIVFTAFPTTDFRAGVFTGWLKFKLAEW